MDYLKGLPCVVCEKFGKRQPGTYYYKDDYQSDPAHTGKTNGMTSKSADTSCIPLCGIHHDEMDGRLNTKIVTKSQFAEKYGLDLSAEAARHYAAYLKEHGNDS